MSVSRRYVARCASFASLKEQSNNDCLERIGKESDRTLSISEVSLSYCLYVSKYYMLSLGPLSCVLEDWIEMSYCESCEEYLGEIASWVEKHRSLGHQVIDFPFSPNMLQ